VRVVLPASRLADSLLLYEAANGRGGVIALDRSAAEDRKAGDSGAQMALRIAVDGYPPVYCSSSKLAAMAAILRLNKNLEESRTFCAWLEELKSSTAQFSKQVEVVVGIQSVKDAAGSLSVGVGTRTVDAAVWRFFSERAGAAGNRLGCDMYGAYTVTVRDILHCGRTKYLTNAVLDAALVELRRRSGGIFASAYVLLTAQSAAFTTCYKVDVAEEAAIVAIKEIFESMGNSEYMRMLMILNINDSHWVAADVLFPTATIRLFDSMDGSFADKKAYVTSRVELFAKEMSRLRHERNPLLSIKTTWTVQPVSEPRQKDAHNCGAFALAHLWCVISGDCLPRFTTVGEHLRVALYLSLLQRGRVYDDA